MNLDPAFIATLNAAGAADVKASAVKALSDFYLAHPGRSTPWHADFAAPAYLAYFLPLNYARVRAVLAEVTRFIPDDAFDRVIDYGSGSGAVHFALEDAPITPRELYVSERSSEARAIHQRLSELRRGRWIIKPHGKNVSPRRTLGIFSYSFLEMQGDLPDLAAHDHLLIVEPSTRECGRQLMGWRQKLIDLGFTALAPCTHDDECPLLTQSNKDWCHHRIEFSGPPWWSALEQSLPMKNRTLTFSYLLLSRTVGDLRRRGSARVIGDSLPERGKTRQMICRGPDREFLSWLHRFGPPPEIPRGALVRGIDTTDPRGAELRVTDQTKLLVGD